MGGVGQTPARSDRAHRPVAERRIQQVHAAALQAAALSFRDQVRELAEQLARSPYVDRLLADKRRARRRDELIKPLNAYRTEELARSYRSFFGDDRSYHEARHRFVYKLGPPCAVTPPPAAAGRRARPG